MAPGMLTEAADGSAPLLRARRARGLSRGRLAALAGVDAKTIYNVERGLTQPYPATQKVLADALGASTAELFPHEHVEPAGGGLDGQERDDGARPTD